eukprot:6548004-Pyramimonas_sp.AAC.1
MATAGPGREGRGSDAERADGSFALLRLAVLPARWWRRDRLFVALVEGPFPDPCFGADRQRASPVAVVGVVV